MASIVEARATLGDKISATLRRDAEAVLPKLQRAGIARAPFDAERVAFGAAMARLALSSPGTAQADGR